MTFNDRVTTLTQEVLLPKVVDNVLNSNVLAFRLAGNAKPARSYDVRKSIKYQNSGTATSFSGLDTFTATQLDTKVKMIYDMRAVRQPIAISGMEAVANGASSEAKITDLVVESLEETEQELIDYFGGLLYSTGTGNSNKDPLGIGAIVDDGTDVATIGGLSRTTYPVLNATRTASGGTLTLAKLATLYTAISSGQGNSIPTLMVSAEAVWDFYEQLLTPQVRESYSFTGYYSVGRTGGAVKGGSHEGLVGQQGFVALSYKGIPWVRDEKATSQNVFMLNENHLNWYGWDASKVSEVGYKGLSLGSSQIEGVYEEAPMAQYAGFNWSGWRTPTNQFGTVADVIILGNLTSFSPRRQGRLTGVTGV